MLRLITMGAIALLGGCATVVQPVKTEPPTTADITPTYNALRELPPPARKVTVAVYDYPDETGQLKSSDDVVDYSKAVTQGAASILIKALQDTGRGRWFSVVERSRLNNLLKERQIVSETRKRHGEAKNLPPLLFAGIILEGGIISFDTNTLTGGVGARYLGIGANHQYRQDTVTVYLRAVSTQTGEILQSVQARKTIASVGVSASVFRFVSFQELLEFEAGFTANEPGQEAIKQAIEKAVEALVIEGAQGGLWAFQDPRVGQQVIANYRQEKQRAATQARAATAPNRQTRKPELASGLRFGNEFERRGRPML